MQDYRFVAPINNAHSTTDTPPLIRDCKPCCAGPSRVYWQMHTNVARHRSHTGSVRLWRRAARPRGNGTTHSKHMKYTYGIWIETCGTLAPTRQVALVRRLDWGMVRSLPAIPARASIRRTYRNRGTTEARTAWPSALSFPALKGKVCRAKDQ